MKWSEPILHVDMDAFFVEVERRRSPGLVGKPVVVGGAGPRGVVAAASYEARGFGVYSAMPMGGARRKCPDLIIVPPDHTFYRQVSELVFDIFRSFTPLVEGLSLDEAFLDVLGLRRHFESPVEIARAVRAEIRSGLGLPASVGIASNKFLAKLASGAAKPDGIHHVPVATQLEFLHALPVDALWGVGEAARASLEQLGVETVGDVAAIQPHVLERRLGAVHGRHLAELAAGVDSRRVTPDGEAKSVSVEETYPVDLVGATVVDAELLAHADALASRLRRSGLAGRTISIKVRFDDFTTVTRSESRRAATDTTREIHATARRLAERIDLTRPVRLIGVAASNLEPADTPRQSSVDSVPEWEHLADAVESVRRRFGDASIEPASLLGREKR